MFLMDCRDPSWVKPGASDSKQKENRNLVNAESGTKDLVGIELTSNFYGTMPVAKKYVKKGEQKYWNDIDPSFMSEESTHECDGELVVRKNTPTFRSEGLPLYSPKVCSITGLNKLIQKLDCRHEQHIVKKKTPSFRHYRRVICSPSKAKPKKNSPTWATSTEIWPCVF